MDESLRVNIQLVHELHGTAVLENLCDLGPSGDELKYIAVILDGPGLVLGSMSHFQGVLQDCNQLLDLAVVQQPGWNPALGGQSLEKIHPFGPFSVSRSVDRSLVRFHWDWELILGNEIICTFRQSVIDRIQDAVLLRDIKVSGQVWQLPCLGRYHMTRRKLQQLMWAIEFIPVGRSSLRAMAGGAPGLFDSTAGASFSQDFRIVERFAKVIVPSQSRRGQTSRMVEFTIDRSRRRV